MPARRPTPDSGSVRSTASAVEQGLDEPVSEAAVAYSHRADLAEQDGVARLLKAEEALLGLTVCEERLDDCPELLPALGGLGDEVFGAIGPVTP